ncbi:MAG: sigma-54 dependent transcriptional regulator [Candidatus Cloacimonetes bacterium]|jgi:DNA-binding NtrC family response regulator|nr:sigma-54 dependent transcriptional regulator [Candidatus Cloacimonadota bacterium]MDY0336497.1 sigma-54 dependent transcriptional regulator [Candidatus Cloacimonadaceae bacterium]MCB5269955.1 sigma-54 dependent transcriptional regulator [Candidatus Cloacimonadota bacterium]MCK9333881.1 sigma-54 dependent transcriptional regulator [Candidatus Cloacimonadota bacterium]MDD2543033.1 sigma-54 dependent transcriptional regulator [Candidatus Cloacimonadota bacterium]
MTDKEIHILIVENNPDTLEMLQRKVQSQRHIVFCASDVPHAITMVEQNKIDIILTDYKMPKLSGLDLIRHINAHHPVIKLIMITGYPTIEGAVEAVKVGAQSYITKPFTDDELFSAINEAIKSIELSVANKPKLNVELGKYGLVGNSKSMQKLYHIIDKSSSNQATVLIQGESGTGKELVARAIHYNSKYHQAPFVPINCGAIPESLLESELFGYTKGSFTGANTSRAGYFITADGGTIFLDEISETSLSMQVKLLRVLQDKQVMMIGSNKARKVNVRIIAATNKDLAVCIKQGTFREDLYYRLNVVPIMVPPLREHSEDIPGLVQHFLTKYARELGQSIPRISENALKRLMQHPWQGNIRELENLIYQLVLMRETNDIRSADLPDYLKYTIESAIDYDRTLAQVEADYIRDILKLTGGNKALTARRLGIDRKTLYNKLDRLRLQ